MIVLTSPEPEKAKGIISPTSLIRFLENDKYLVKQKNMLILDVSNILIFCQHRNQEV